MCDACQKWGRTDGELNTRSRINLENKTKRQIDKKAKRSEDEKI